MNKTSKFMSLIFFLAVVAWIMSSSYVVAQEIGIDMSGPKPPPVEISLTMENTIIVPGDEVVLHLEVTPLEDMHLDIRCVFPEGVMPAMGPGIMMQPYVGRNMHSFDDPFMGMPIQGNAVVLSVGPVVGGQMKEFVFRVTIPEAGSYEFIAVVEALAKWGVKKEKLMVNVN